MAAFLNARLAMSPAAWLGAVILALVAVVATPALPPVQARAAEVGQRDPVRPGVGGGPQPEATANVQHATLDLDELERRLRETPAIGLFTKISLRNQVEDLVEQFRGYHDGGAAASLSRLRERFDLLVMKVLSLLQDRDPMLARDVAASREALWGMLADPHTFATLSPEGRAAS